MDVAFKTRKLEKSLTDSREMSSKHTETERRRSTRD